MADLMNDSTSNHKLTDFVARYWHYGHILEMGDKRFTADYCLPIDFSEQVSANKKAKRLADQHLAM